MRCEPTGPRAQSVVPLPGPGLAVEKANVFQELESSLIQNPAWFFGPAPKSKTTS